MCFLIWQKRPGSPRQRDEKSYAKPPLPSNTASQFRKGAYHESLDFVLSLCETSYGLVDIFPIEDRKSALREVVYAFIRQPFYIMFMMFMCLNVPDFFLFPMILGACRDQSTSI